MNNRVSVVICCHTERRWDDLCSAIGSACAQEGVNGEVVVVVDHNPELHDRLNARYTDRARLRIVENRETAGLSGARNTGIQVATGDVVVFLDDDARAEPKWLAHMVEGMADPNVVGVGGWAEPRWDQGRPAWFPNEFLWVVGCSYRGLPGRGEDIRNPIGCNMAFRTDALRSVGGFHNNLGRTATGSMGCEETELSIRIAQALPHTRIVHVPEAVVWHRVPAERATWRYFLRRCFDEGRSKAQVKRMHGSGPALSSERIYVTSTLPTGVAQSAQRLTRSVGESFGRIGAIGLGLLVAAAGFAGGRLERSS